MKQKKSAFEERLEKLNSAMYIERIYLVSSLIMLAATFLGRNLFRSWFGLLFGLICIVPGIIIYLIAKKKKSFLYYISIVLNSIGTGFSISAYYTVKEQICDVSIVLAALALAALMFICCQVMYAFTKRSNLGSLICLALILAALISFVILQGMYHVPFFSYGFFGAIQILIYYIVLRKRSTDREEILRQLSLGSFGIYAIITIIVIAIITDGDSLDFIDLDFTSSKKKNMK